MQVTKFGSLLGLGQQALGKPLALASIGVADLNDIHCASQAPS